MIPNPRREALIALMELSDLVPEIRIGQLVAHLGFLSEDEGGRGLGDIEDHELLAMVRRHRAELANMSGANTNKPLEQTAAS